MNRASALLFCLLLAVCVAFPGGLVAQEGHGGRGAESNEDHATEGEHGDEGELVEEHEHKNSIAVFIGATQADKEHGERDDPQFTIGFDYERYLTKVFGVGAILDVVLEGQREGILAVAGVAHAGSAKFVLAPGGERVRDTGDWEGIVRLGFMWEFPVGKVHLEPSLFYDVTEEGDAWVLGLTIGKGF